MNTRAVVGVPLAAVMILAAACGVRDDALNDLDPEAGTATVVIHVQNRAAQQATVFIIPEGGSRARVGEVPAHAERFFERDVWLARTLEFDIRILAGRTYRTSSIPAYAGDTIQVTIPAHL